MIDPLSLIDNPIIQLLNQLMIGLHASEILQTDDAALAFLLFNKAFHFLGLSGDGLLVHFLAHGEGKGGVFKILHQFLNVKTHFRDIGVFLLKVLLQFKGFLTFKSYLDVHLIDLVVELINVRLVLFL